MKYVRVAISHFNLNAYDFITDLDLKKGDIVVCHTHSGFVVGKVRCILESSKYANKWIICKVNLTQHKSREKKLSRSK